MFDKSSKCWQYLKWIILVLEILVWNIVGLFEFFQFATGVIPAPRLMFYLLPLCIHAVFSISNLYLFPLEYGYFGTKERSKAPSQMPSQKIASWAYVGRARGCQVTWSFYDVGFEMNIWGFGRVFVPWNTISHTETSWWGSLVIHHLCKEVRSPITCSAEIGKIILNSLQNERYQNTSFKERQELGN